MADEDKVARTDQEWRHCLSPEQYRVLRKHGTERAFTGEYHDSKEPGVYRCAGCGTALFSSDTKFDSGTGWPSFFEPRRAGRRRDPDGRQLLHARTEVLCAACEGHLGHVFDDGPRAHAASATASTRPRCGSSAIRAPTRSELRRAIRC